MITAMIARTLSVIAFAAFASGALAQTATEPARPYLKANVTVSSDIVRIGDLVENAGIVANVAIFRAPDLGTTGAVPAAAVVEAVRPHAIIGLDTAGLSEVTVTRASREIPIADIERSLAQALAARFNLGAVNEIAVLFDRNPSSIQVDAAAKGDVQIGRLTYNQTTSRFDAALDIPTGVGQRGVLRLSGRAFASVETVMVTHNVDRGAVLRAADLTVERRPRAEVGRDVMTKIDQALGMAARGSLRPGQPLRAADLQKPEMVQRGEMVTLVYEAPGLTLTMRGKAVDGGAQGDTVAVLNEQSKRTVQGTVVGPGHVVVSSTMPRLTANLAVAAEPAK